MRMSSISYPALNYQSLYPVVSPLPQTRPPKEPPIELEEAEIRWGKASNFGYGTRKGPHIKYQVKVKWPDDDDDEEEEPEIPVLTFTEVEGTRQTTTKRLTPENADPNIWVEFELTDSITFEGDIGAIPEGYRGPIQVQYVLKNPA
jgi:hypothetical protein